MKGVTIVMGIGLLAVSTTPARAEEWRDGCPAGNRFGYHSTNRWWVGAPPQTDAAISPNRLTLGAVSTYFTPSDNVARARLLTGTERAQVTVLHGSSLSLGFTESYVYAHQMAGDSDVAAPHGSGNITAGVVLRGAWLTSFFGSESAGADVLAGLRHGFALEASVGRSWNEDLDAVSLSGRFPFESYMFTSDDTSANVAIEYRAEGVGCYAPFVHLRVLTTVTQWGPFVLAAPVTAAVGFYATDKTALIGQYGIAVHYSPNKMAEQQLYGADVVHRFRFALEHTSEFWSQRWDVGAHIDVFSGSDTLQGTVLGLYGSWHVQREQIQ